MAGFLFDIGGHRGIGADGPGNFTHGNGFLGFSKPAQVAPHFFNPEGYLQTERGRLGMYTVGTAYHHRVFMLYCPLCQDSREFFDILK